MRRGAWAAAEELHRSDDGCGAFPSGFLGVDVSAIVSGLKRVSMQKPLSRASADGRISGTEMKAELAKAHFETKSIGADFVTAR